MKTRIKKIIIMAVALLFVSVGVSFAHDFKSNSKKSPGNSYVQNKKGHDDQHPSWKNKHPEPKYFAWKRNHLRKVRKIRHYHVPKHRHVPQPRTLFGFKANDSDYKIVVVVKDRR